MTQQKELLEKYYRGETSLSEEEALRSEDWENKSDAEQDIFGYYKSEGRVPEDLNREMMGAIEQREESKRSFRIRLYRITSAVAVVLVLLSLFLSDRIARNNFEEDFMIMEQALFQVSESIQPEEQSEMLVLWVDDNVEIIIN